MTEKDTAINDTERGTSPEHEDARGDERAEGSADAAFDDPNAEVLELSEQAAELVRQLQAERDEAVERYARALADFKNFQRRSQENERRALESGSTRVVRALLPALDQFDLALQMDPSTSSTEQYAQGVRLAWGEMLRVLGGFGVDRVDPDAGEPFDPNEHEAVQQEVAEDMPGQRVVRVYQAGYRMADVVIRPAKVVVSAGPANDLGEDAPAG